MSHFVKERRFVVSMELKSDDKQILFLYFLFLTNDKQIRMTTHHFAAGFKPDRRKDRQTDGGRFPVPSSPEKLIVNTTSYGSLPNNNPPSPLPLSPPTTTSCHSSSSPSPFQPHFTLSPLPSVSLSLSQTLLQSPQTKEAPSLSQRPRAAPQPGRAAVGG